MTQATANVPVGGAQRVLDDDGDSPVPTLEPERWVTRQQLAAIMCLSVRTIDSMVEDGMPSDTWGRRTRRFLPSKAIAWARKQGPPA